MDQQRSQKCHMIPKECGDKIWLERGHPWEPSEFLFLSSLTCSTVGIFGHRERGACTLGLYSFRSSWNKCTGIPLLVLCTCAQIGMTVHSVSCYFWRSSLSQTKLEQMWCGDLSYFPFYRSTLSNLSTHVVPKSCLKVDRRGQFIRQTRVSLWI